MHLVNGVNASIVLVGTFPVRSPGWFGVARPLCLFDALLLGRIAALVVTAAYCYTRSSVVCLSVCLSLGHVRDPAKTADQINMPLGGWVRWAQGTMC